MHSKREARDETQRVTPVHRLLNHKTNIGELESERPTKALTLLDAIVVSGLFFGSGCGAVVEERAGAGSTSKAGGGDLL